MLFLDAYYAFLLLSISEYGDRNLKELRKKSSKITE